MGPQIVGGVVVGDIAAEGKIVAGQAVIEEHGEVRVVRQCFVDHGEQRSRGIGGDTVCVKIDQRTIAGTGLEQQAGTLVAPRLGIDGDADARPKGWIVEEGVGAEQARLLAVGEQRQDRMPRLHATRLQRTHGLEDGRDAGLVVGRAGSGGNRVIVRQQDDRLALAWRNFGDHVFHGATGEEAVLRPALAAHGAVDAGLDAEYGEFGADAVAHGLVRRRRDGMGHFRSE